jgi:glutaminyl-peptide cyclotransferase
MGWRKILVGAPCNQPLAMGFVLLPLVLAAPLSLILSAIHWFHPAEAKAAMLAPPAPIDGKRAYGYLKEICAIGPRLAGSDENARQRKLVADHFKEKGGKVREQPFGAVHPLTGRKLNMVNLIGSWNTDRLQRVVIAAHYDTRPNPDQEVDPLRVKLPFIGANDCASGVALLMEIANHLNDLETPWGVDLVLFDGEELVYGNDPYEGEYFLGSTEFARKYVELRDGRRDKMRYVAGLLLDMVGGIDLQIKQEPNSVRGARDVVREVWGVARALGVKSFIARQGREVRDDHLPLLRAGIPTIDLIDFDYRFWHKADDLPENCSAESLADVGRVITAWLALPKRRITR